jgi:hypothetical protein
MPKGATKVPLELKVSDPPGVNPPKTPTFDVPIGMI